MTEIDLLTEINEISKVHALQRNDIDQIMVEFAERITKSLRIERMSVWIINEVSDSFTSMGEFDSRNGTFKKESIIQLSTVSTYYKEVSKDKMLYVPNVLESPITAELKDGYSIPNQVITLLDFPLRFDGKMIGVMCFEKTGDVPHVFTDKEKFFAMAISMVFASNLEARHRRALQHKLDLELQEKETLLKEIHHRVKNNLSVVSSLIKMQSEKARDEFHRSLLDECRNKIHTIADIHELVYQSKHFSAISVKSYFTKLIGEIDLFYRNTVQGIETDLDLDDFDLPLEKMIPLGLIVNEVVTNCYKHAFDSVQNGRILVQLKKGGNQLSLSIMDTGIGFAKDVANEEKLGMEIINDLCGQLDAAYSYTGKNGTTFNLSMHV